MKVLGEVTLITSYLDEATKRPGHERLRDWFASVWEVSHLELRLALLEAGKGVTFLSDRLLGELDGFVALPALEFGAIRRTVGIYYKKHKPLSEAAKRFLAIVESDFPPHPASRSPE